MKLTFDSQDQKNQVIARVKNVAPEIARDLYLNFLEEGTIVGEAPKPEVEQLPVDEDVPQI